MKNPMLLKDNAQHTGSQQKSKYIMDGVIGKWKVYVAKKFEDEEKISSLTCCESSGTIGEVTAMRVEEQPQVKLKF